MIRVLLVFFFFTIITYSDEKEKVQKVVKEYTNLFKKNDWEALYKISHPELTNKIRTLIFKNIPKSSEDISKDQKETVEFFLQILKVKTVEEAWELDLKSLYLNYWAYLENTPVMKSLAMAEPKKPTIIISKQENFYVASVTGEARLNGKLYKATRKITVKSHEGVLKIADVGKAEYHYDTFVLDKVGIELKLPYNWKKNPVDVDKIKSSEDFSEEDINEIKKHMKSLIFSYHAVDLLKKQTATITISSEKPENDETIDGTLKIIKEELKSYSLFKNARIELDGAPKIKIPNSRSVFVDTPNMKQYSYLFMHKGDIVTININTDKIPVTQIIESIKPLKSL